LFFFQAEDGIRGFHVTGVQTCALPICTRAVNPFPARARPTACGRACTKRWVGRPALHGPRRAESPAFAATSGSPPPNRRRGARQIGRASCRERVWNAAEAVPSRERRGG